MMRILIITFIWAIVAIASADCAPLSIAVESLDKLAQSERLKANLKPGNIVGGKERTIVITETPQEIFSHHADFKGGGVYYSAKIYIKDTNVVIEEINSVSNHAKKSKGGTNKNKVYTIKIAEINSKPIKLQIGNQLTITKLKKNGLTRRCTNL